MKSLFGLCLLLVVALSTKSVVADNLETVGEEELNKLIAQEQYVIVLFTDEETKMERAEEFEGELATVREDLVDSLNAWVVKAHNHPIKKQLLPTAGPEPTIAFFRNQIPVLYDGPANEEEMLEIIYRSKEPCVRELTDTSFEHLTQASTGATTGDWFVFFYREECEECFLMEARLETLACRHKGRLNVARVDKGGAGAVTARRFEVATPPAYILFRLGRMYRYEIEKYDIESMSSFVTGWYKNVKGESIPLPKTPFDDLIQMCVDYLRDYPALIGVMIGLPILLALTFYFLLRSDDERKPKKKKKNKDKSKKEAENKEKAA